MKFLHAACKVAAFLIVFASTGASAAVIGSSTNVDFSGGATTFAYDDSSFTLSDNHACCFDPSPVDIMTGGSGAATSFFGQPTVYFDPVRGFGPLTFDSGYVYSAFPTATVIPYSATASFIGLEPGAADGTPFGYAEFNGTDLVSYAFQTVAGQGD